MSTQNNLDRIYDKTHRDYKGICAGERYILAFIDGATRMVILNELTEQQIAEWLRVLKC